MDSFYRPTRVEISLDALRHNLEAFRRVLPEQVGMMAVVKADAYGHGAVEVCREALNCGVEYIAVAFLDEALELRRAGINAPLLVLGYTPPEGLLPAWEQDITLNIYTRELLEAWRALWPRLSRQPVNNDSGRQPSLREIAASAAPASSPVPPANTGEAGADSVVPKKEEVAAAAGQDRIKPLKVHVKLDSGMNRLGVTTMEEAIELIDLARSLPGMEVEGLFTHYACADEKDKTYTRQQHERFSLVVNHYAAQGIRFRRVHAGNSAAAIDSPELTFNMVRLGISMYGLYPSEEVNRQQIELEPVMSIKTGVVMVKKVPPQSGVSYGAIYRTATEETIATLPIGYADGYSRMLTGKAQVLVKGRRMPVVGRICMDQCMVNVTGISDVDMEEEVVILGRQGDERITAEEHAQWLGTINYEITCMVSHRVPRVYVRNGRIVSTVNPLLRHI